MSSTYKEIEPMRRCPQEHRDSRNFPAGGWGLSRGQPPGLWDLPQSPVPCWQNRGNSRPGWCQRSAWWHREDPGGRAGRASPGLWHRRKREGGRETVLKNSGWTQRCWLALRRRERGPEAEGLGGPVTALRPQQHWLARYWGSSLWSPNALEGLDTEAAAVSVHRH